MRKAILKNYKKRHDNQSDFYRVFGVSLSVYFDPFTGFDIIKFDDAVIQSAPNKSMKNEVLSKYGKEGVTIINALLA